MNLTSLHDLIELTIAPIPALIAWTLACVPVVRARASPPVQDHGDDRA